MSPMFSSRPRRLNERLEKYLNLSGLHQLTFEAKSALITRKKRSGNFNLIVLSKK